MTDAVCDSIRVSSQVYPELGKLASDGGLAHSSQAPSSERHARTKSEEDEYQYQQSVELMRREQMQNDILLDTVKRIQVRGCWSRPLGHSFDSLIRLAHSTRSLARLPGVIGGVAVRERDCAVADCDRAKAGTALYDGSLPYYHSDFPLLLLLLFPFQGFINRLHAEGMELAEEIEAWRLKLRDEEDRSRAERERVEATSLGVEAAIEVIAQDKQLAVQRLGQYELLYTRTMEDRNAAESAMLRARELVSMGREDLQALGECLLQTKAAQEKHEKELSATMARLESSRATWRSSLEQRTGEIEGIIRRYEEAKRGRIEEEEAAAQRRLEAERVRREMEAREAEREARMKKELVRANSVQADQWRVVCAAAGVDEASGAVEVIQAYDALERAGNANVPVYSHNGDGGGGDRGGDGDGVGCPDAAAVRTTGRRDTMHRPHDQHAFTPSITTRAEMSLRLIRQKLSSHLGEDEAAAVDDDMLVAQLGRLAERSGGDAALADLWALARADDDGDGDGDLAFLGKSPHREPRAAPAVAEAAGTPDGDQDPQAARILSRHEVKARSRKIKAKLDKYVIYS